MKTQSVARLLACGIASLSHPLAAQNFPDPYRAQYPPIGESRVESSPSDHGPCFDRQSPLSLFPRGIPSVENDPPLDRDLLRQKSPLEVASQLTAVGSAQIPPAQLAECLSRLSASYREPAQPVPANECPELALAVEQRIRIDPRRALEVVELEITANPSCACEVVKAAIKSGGEDSTFVLAIVEASINAAPEHMRLIAQCAIAVSPDSSAGIQSLIARLDPNGGDSSSVISAKCAITPIQARRDPIPSSNPLDLPPSLVITPLPVFPPLVTIVDP